MAAKTEPCIFNPETGETSPLKEFTNDSAEKQAVGGIKYDGGKAPIFRGGLGYFPRAIREVSSVSGFGASKYAWNGWQQVDDGVNRYTDALVRHLAYEAEGETLDPDSGLLHAAHAAWNSLARLELLLRQQEQELLLREQEVQAASEIPEDRDKYYSFSHWGLHKP